MAIRLRAIRTHLANLVIFAVWIGINNWIVSRISIAIPGLWIIEMIFCTCVLSIRTQETSHGATVVACPEVVEVGLRVALFSTELVVVDCDLRLVLFAVGQERALPDGITHPIRHQSRRADLVAVVIGRGELGQIAYTLRMLYRGCDTRNTTCIHN